MPQLGWTARPDGTIDFLNRGWHEYTGLPFGRLDAEARRTVHDPSSHATVLQQWSESIRAGLPFETEVRLRRHDGVFRSFMTRVNPIRDARGVLLRWVAISTDIDDQVSGRKRDQDDLTHFFDASLDLLCIAGVDGYFKRVNAAWATLGWSEDELLANPWIDLVHAEDREATLGARSTLVAGRPITAFTNRYRCKDGTHRWIEWRSAPSLERGLIYGCARDITTRRREEDERDELQERLVAADRMASVGTLAAGVAHEINNPLFSLISNLDLVLGRAGALPGDDTSGRTDGVRDMIRDAREAADRVRGVVADLLMLARATEDHRVVTDVRTTLERAIRVAAPAIGQCAKLVEDYGEAPYVEADDARLGQVFLHLLVNATQAIDPGDANANEIRVSTSTGPSGAAVIEVHDTGCGIPEETIGRIFDPFFTTKRVGAGRGLGLAISRNLVAGMAGEISASSERGHGTTLRVVLPAAPVQVLPSRSRPRGIDLAPALGDRRPIG